MLSECRMNWNGSTRKSMRWRSDPAEDDPLRRAHFALRTVPGIQRITAWTIIAEIGVDMTNFRRQSNWRAGQVCAPGNSESAEAQIGENTQGRRYLRRMLTQTAWAIARRKDGGF